MNDILAMWYVWLPAMLGVAVGLIWPTESRRFFFIVLFGLPALALGYLFGYIQAGFMTGYQLYIKDRA